jgi:hypothetical protein
MTPPSLIPRHFVETRTRDGRARAAGPHSPTRLFPCPLQPTTPTVSPPPGAVCTKSWLNEKENADARYSHGAVVVKKSFSQYHAGAVENLLRSCERRLLPL